ncbi:16725_t:CDS:2, partial [Entrophospora sp. SA101]
MIGRDPHPRIYTESGFKNLPNGRRAHEMLDKVTEWLSFLRDLKENFDIVFGQELLEALELLDSDEWGSLYDSLERGIIKALEHFENWMLPWLHLPLSICRLGGDNGQAFARSYYYVFFSKSWVNEPSQIEINYAEQLQNDLENFFTDDFGLQNHSTGHLDLASDESIFRKLNKLNESETEIRLLLGAWHTSKAMCGTLLTIFSGYGIYNLAANLG